MAALSLSFSHELTTLRTFESVEIEERKSLGSLSWPVWLSQMKCWSIAQNASMADPNPEQPQPTVVTDHAQHQALSNDENHP